LTGLGRGAVAWWIEHSARD